MRLGQALKDDRFITAIRQRLMIPGGCCSFDLPSFYLWLEQLQEKRDRQVQNWLQHLAILDEALSCCMQMIRQMGNLNHLFVAIIFFKKPMASLI